MRIEQKFLSGLAFLRAKTFGLPGPLVIRWQVTDRCDGSCIYCGLWQKPRQEMSLNHILKVLEEIAGLGIKRISFSGGEPLLREDIGEILRQTKRMKISPSMNTNGAHIPEKLKELENVDLLKITVNGPRDIHNKIQGDKDLFDRTMEGAEVAARKKIPFSFATTLTRYNIEHLDFEGHCQDPECEAAIMGLLRRTSFVKLLGSYPAATTPVFDTHQSI